MADMSLKCEADIELVNPASGTKLKFPMRGTMGCLFEMEQMSGRGFFELVERLRVSKASMTDLAAIITAGLRAADQPAELPKVSEMIFLTGPGLVLPYVDVFMQRLLLGGRDLGELLAEERRRQPDEPTSTSDVTSASASPSSAGPKTNSGEPHQPASTPPSTGTTSETAATTQTAKPRSRPGKRKSKPA